MTNPPRTGFQIDNIGEPVIPKEPLMDIVRKWNDTAKRWMELAESAPSNYSGIHIGILLDRANLLKACARELEVKLNGEM